jgi:hypothetical protein
MSSNDLKDSISMTKSPSKFYTCAGCGGVFEKIRTDDEAMAEATETFGPALGDDVAVVCEDCYKRLVPDEVKL